MPACFFFLLYLLPYVMFYSYIHILEMCIIYKAQRLTIFIILKKRRREYIYIFYIYIYGSLFYYVMSQFSSYRSYLRISLSLFHALIYSHACMHIYLSIYSLSPSLSLFHSHSLPFSHNSRDLLCRGKYA